MSKTDNLKTSHYFHTPVYDVEIPEWINSVNKVCNKYIKQAQKRNQPVVKEREKRYKKKIGDLNMSHHSISMINDPLLKEFQSYIGATSHNILEDMGYDLSNYDFNDPRIAKTMNDLPVKSSKEVSVATPLIHYRPKPGTMIFFPAYINHGFTVDD